MSLVSPNLLLAGLLSSVAALGVTLTAPGAPQATDSLPFGAFAFKDSVEVPLPAEEAFDRFVEVDAWWDHRFSEAPVRFAIDARPGGGFVEIFDESGNGVLHATVIYAERGKILRMDGPLGLSGYALNQVYTLRFQATDRGTRVQLEVRGAGELQEGWPDLIRGVWHHFLAERYQPYAAGSVG